MSWRYKLYNIQPEQVVTIDPINDNFQPFVEEAAGGLNEHNFTAEALDRTHFADDAALVVHTSQANNVREGLIGYDDPSGANWVTIQPVETWQTFPDTGLTVTFTTKATTLYLCASFNIHCGTNWVNEDGPALGGSARVYKQLGFGYLVALRFDGTVINETILGSGDAGVDDFQARDFVTSDDLNANFVRPQGGGGISGARLPLTVDAVVEALPGEHTVDVVVMNIKGSMRTAASLSTYIGQREIFALELVR